MHRSHALEPPSYPCRRRRGSWLRRRPPTPHAPLRAWPSSRSTAQRALRCSGATASERVWGTTIASHVGAPSTTYTHGCSCAHVCGAHGPCPRHSAHVPVLLPRRARGRGQRRVQRKGAARAPAPPGPLPRCAADAPARACNRSLLLKAKAKKRKHRPSDYTGCTILEISACPRRGAPLASRKWWSAACQRWQRAGWSRR